MNRLLFKLLREVAVGAASGLATYGIYKLLERQERRDNRAGEKSEKY